jgi:hypothetical protein
VKNFLADNWDRNRAIRRGGSHQFIPLEPEKAEAFYDAASAPDSTAEHLFELRWAKTVIAGALNSLRAYRQRTGHTSGPSTTQRGGRRRRQWLLLSFLIATPLEM